jgi:hypothetical protein
MNADDDAMVLQADRLQGTRTKARQLPNLTGRCRLSRCSGSAAYQNVVA